MYAEGSDLDNFGTYILNSLYLKDYNFLKKFLTHKYFFSHLKGEQC